MKDASAREAGAADAPVTVTAERSARLGERAFDPLAFVPARVNARITKRYEIEQHIGAGSHGKVFVAADREIKGRLVAIKEFLARQQSRRQFEHEASVMKALDHPNICKLLETYERGDSMFLVMEYCAGGELFERIFSHADLLEDACADIVRQVAGALKHAHKRGIVHRDLKPENVCLVEVAPSPGCMPVMASICQGRCTTEPRTHVKVIDWGVSAQFQGDACQMRARVGTVAYAAPEVLKASSGSGGYTSSCDVWSLGVLAQVLLTGTLPFGGNGPLAPARAKSGGNVRLRNPEWSGVSALAKSFVSSCLRPDPTSRPAASALLKHKWLARGGAGRPIEAARLMPILQSLQQSSLSAYPLSVYATLVARQLDHQGLRELPQVFQQFDSDGNGELSLSEFKSAFEALRRSGSKELLDIERTFELLDSDGSGSINYTEFIAAGLGERVKSEESLKVAFKAFDAHDDDGRISRTEFAEAMARLAMCQEEFAVEKVFSEFDADGDGALNFQEWKEWVKSSILRVR